MTDLEHLLAIEAIKSLKSRYFQCLDGKDWDGLRAIFAPDLLADMRDGSGVRMEALVFEGRDAFMAMLVPMLGRQQTVHHGHMPDITIESATQARGIWAMEDRLWAPEDSGMPYRQMHGFGHYHERYEKRDGVWLIRELRLTRQRVDAS